MSSRLNRLIFQGKVTLCLILMVQMQFLMGGCGIGAGSLLPADQLRIPINFGDEMNLALRNTPFSSATAIDVFPSQQNFSLVIPDSTRKLSGKYAFRDNAFTITEFFVQNANRSATIMMDDFKHVSRITTSNGLDWKLPPDTSKSNVASAISATGLDAYLQANSVLLDVAKQLDVESATAAGASPTSAVGSTSPATTEPKSSAALSPAVGVLYVIATIWYPIIGILDTLVTVFTVSTLLQSSLIGRFDGTWQASNASSDLIVTIAGGKITKIVDPSSGQQFDVTNADPATVDGNRVTFSADATVLGQDTPVTFEFEVQEMSNGSLAGSLSVFGDTFARVPVTMVRA